MPMHTIIQQQRKALGLTQEQVARCLNVSTAAVSKWENGLTSPDVGLLPPPGPAVEGGHERPV